MTEDLTTPRRLHLLGVGGMGVMPLAIGLAQAGWMISGEDDALEWHTAKLLREGGVGLLGIESLDDWAQLDTVVYSAAIDEEHPARVFAENHGIPTRVRGAFLAEYSKSSQLIAIVGSHGKSTTAALCAYLLSKHQHNADYYVGALFQNAALPSARLNGADVLFAEIDESDGTLLACEPEVLCILNMDWDHADRYKTELDYRATLLELASKTRSVVFVPENALSEFRGHMQAGAELRGLSPKQDYNEYNQAAAFQLVAHKFPDSGVLDTKDFPGLQRRQQLLWSQDSREVWHDYAHHPQEIVSFIGWLRNTNLEARLEVFFEPHRFSRSKHLAKEIIDSLSLADVVFILPIYAAGEKSREINAFDFEKYIAETNTVFSIKLSAEDVLSDLEKQKFPENTIRAFVGAGSINVLADAYRCVLEHGVQGFAQYLLNALGPDSVRVQEGLSGKTTMRAGGPAEVYVEPLDREALRFTLKAAALWRREVFFLGKGSNLIVPDSGIRGCVIRLNQPTWCEIQRVDAVTLQVGAGVRLRDVCKEAERNNMGGFEFMEGIPASLGGALRMNAGAMGGWMSDIIDSIEVMTREGRIHHLSKNDLHYGYRSIQELADCVALSARLRANESIQSSAVKTRILENMQKRKKSQPREASAGCIFKNPEGAHAGRLIDECGLKGYRVGDAQVSNTHANFIVNLGSASAQDIIGLVGHIRSTVAEKKGVLLEPEAILVGMTWEEALAR